MPRAKPTVKTDFAIAQDGSDTLIRLNSDTSDSIRLAGIDATTIDGADFADLVDHTTLAVAYAAIELPQGRGGYLASQPVETINVPTQDGGYLSDNHLFDEFDLPLIGGGYVIPETGSLEDDFDIVEAPDNSYGTPWHIADLEQFHAAIRLDVPMEASDFAAF